MNFYKDNLQSGLLTFGQPEEWDWTRNGGSYSKKRDFFRVHWEVHHPEEKPDFAHSVRLHVESPSHSTDSELNDIKLQVVEALLSAGLEKVAEKNELDYKRGVFASVDHIRKHRCTEAFRVTLPSGKRDGTPKQNIEMVHAALGNAVKTVLEPFYAALNSQFEK